MKGSHGWRLGMAALLTGSALFACRPAPPAIERIEVVGDLAVDGRGSVVWARTFGSDCRADTGTDAAAAPLVGVAGGTITLTVTTAACARDPAAPATYRWEIEGTPLRGTAAPGEPATLAVTLPESSGAYRLLVRGPPRPRRSPLAIELLVTPAAPAAEFASSAPSVTAWRAAATWGAGFDATSEPEAVLTQLVARLYAHARDNWSYGYARRVGDCILFDDRVVGCDEPGGRLQVTCSPERGCEQSGRLCRPNGDCFDIDLVCTPGATRCKCAWNELLDPDTPCDFSDCFVMSTLLAKTAAILGVDDVTTETFRGSNGHGFLTHDAARAFDLRFPGSADCSGGRCRGYVFSAHNVAFLSSDGSGGASGTYFDPTFGRVYERTEEVIALDVSEAASIPAGPSGTDLTFVDSDLRLCQLAAGYATWPYYAEQTTADNVCPGDPTRPARFVGDLRLAHLDPDTDGDPDGIVVEVDVEVIVAGTYRVGAALLHAESGEKHAAAGATHPASAPLDATVGRHTVRLEFNDDVADHGHDLRLYTFSRQGRSDALSATVMPPPDDTNDMLTLREIVVRGTNPGPEGRFTDLTVRVALDTGLAGAFTIEASLRKLETVVTTVKRAVELDGGSATVTVTLPGAAIRASNVDAPYELGLRLTDASGNVVLDAGHAVCCLAAADFGAAGS